MPDYPFICQKCDKQQISLFMTIAEYSAAIKDAQTTAFCETCHRKTTFDRIIGPFQIMGGSKHYKSVEKYWDERPVEKRIKEEQLKQEMAKRKQAILDKATNKVTSKREDRRKGYKEERLRLDD